MTYEKYRDKLHNLTFTAGMNCRYHQILEFRWSVWDKLIRVAIVVLALADVLLSALEVHYWALGVAVAAGLIAIVLNIIPFGDWEKQHGELFRLWNDLRSDVELEETKTCHNDEDHTVEAHCVERLIEIQNKSNALHSMEHASNAKLLLECFMAEEKAMSKTVPSAMATVAEQGLEAGAVEPAAAEVAVT